MNKFLAVAVSAMLAFAVVGCDGWSSSNTDNKNDGITKPDNVGELRHIGTISGECRNLLSQSGSSDVKPIDIITPSADSLRVKTEISFNCSGKFETEVAIDGKIIRMRIKDVRERTDIVAACDCIYPFEFQFTRKKDEVDYHYIIEFVPQDDEPRRIAEVFMVID